MMSWTPSLSILPAVPGECSPRRSSPPKTTVSILPMAPTGSKQVYEGVSGWFVLDPFKFLSIWSDIFYLEYKRFVGCF